MFPVRCYTCDTVLGQHWMVFSKRRRDGCKEIDILKDLGQSRMCCRRMFLAHVDLLPEQRQYPCVDVVLDECGTTLHRRVNHVRTTSCD